jgi:transposase
MSATVAQERLVEVAEGESARRPERTPAGEQKTFRSYDPDQVLLISPVLSEWVPEGDLAHFVSDLIETGVLDLSAIYASYEGERGYPPYDPRLMVKLLVYGYANGVMSSRKLERATYRDVGVRMLCADQHPDYRSIARFRKRHLEALGELFVQALRLCKQAEMVGLGTLALDGTKLRANASRHKAMSYERMVRKESQLQGEIAQLRKNVDALLADAEQLRPALEQLQENLDAIDAQLPEDAALTADAGYFSEENVKITTEHGLDPFIATGRFKRSEPPAPAPRGPIPKDATPKQRMARKLKTKQGHTVYARRKAIVEPVFGQMHTVQDARQLLLRGKPAARAQWRFHCAIHNLLKVHRNGGLTLIGTG